MRYLAGICFSFSAAIFVAQYFSAEITIAVAAVVCVVLLIYAAQSRVREKRLFCLLLTTAATFGLCYNMLYNHSITNAAEFLVGQNIIADAEVCSYPTKGSYQSSVEAYLHSNGKQIKVKLYGTGAIAGLKPGDRVLAQASVHSAMYMHEKRVNTFTSKGIWLLLYTKGAVMTAKTNDIPVKYLPVTVSKAVKEHILILYEKDIAQFMTAILTGDKTLLSDAMYSDLTETGIIHITAVSGMHCAFLFGLIVTLTGKRRRLSAFLGIPLLLLFMLMTGATPSVVRACIMLILLSLAPIFNRENDYPTAIGVALCIILLRNPFAATSVSLQLSFAAVTGILLFAKRLYQLLMPQRKNALLRLIAASLSTTFGATVFTLPLGMYYFGCISLIAWLTNLLCLWAASWIFIAGIVSVVLSFIFMPLAQIVAFLGAVLIKYLFWVVHLLARVPNHAVYADNPYILYWTAYAYTLLAVCILMKAKRKSYAIAAILSALSLTVVLYLPRIEASRQAMEVIAVDVGQGASTIFVSDGKAAVVDCGSGNSWINAGDCTADALQTLGYNKIDCVILTHYHSDHANGLSTLLSRVKVSEIYLPDIHPEDYLRVEVESLAQMYDIHIKYINEESVTQLGNAAVTIYPPLTAGDTNEECLAVLCSCKDFDTLILGDMDSGIEKLLVDKIALPKTEVLMVAHHGSKSSTGLDLLEEIQPDVGIISVGDNSYGHPGAAVLGRLYEQGADVHRTDKNGNITIAVH